MHYLLECEEPLSPNGEALLEIHNTFRVGGIRLWKSGTRHLKPVPQPIEIPFDTFRGYDGPPVELLDLGIPIMSARLAEELAAAGVSNIDLYDATLVHRGTGARYPYKAFNILGLVAAADLGKSEQVGEGSFTRLVLDEAACRGRLLFRLEENVNAIVVSEEVRDHLIAKGFTTLRFRRPEDWVQL
ncbi:MAG: hypothetical protein QM765_30055 [Myxococcales bacterium]